MATCLRIDKDGNAHRDALITAVGDDEMQWVDIIGPHEAELGALVAVFGFHPLAIDDCRTFDQRPKLEPYPDHLFAVVHALRGTNDGIEAIELHAFIGERFLVTVHSAPLEELEQAFARVERDPEAKRRGPAFWYYVVAERILATTHREIDALAERIEDLQDAVVDGRPTAAVVPGIFAAKRRIAQARRFVSPQRELFAGLSTFGSPIITGRGTLYFRALHDEVVRAVESIESNREFLANALDAYFSAVSQRTNEVVKHLTLLSSIFLPLTFVTGFFGMNFQALPFSSVALMWFGIGLCVALPTAMILWFRFRNWM